MCRELSYLKLFGHDAPLEDIVGKEHPQLEGKYSQETLLEFQRFLLLNDIKNIILKLEKEASENGNPTIKKPIE